MGISGMIFLHLFSTLYSGTLYFISVWHFQVVKRQDKVMVISTDFECSASKFRTNDLQFGPLVLPVGTERVGSEKL